MLRFCSNAARGHSDRGAASRHNKLTFAVRAGARYLPKKTRVPSGDPVGQVITLAAVFLAWIAITGMAVYLRAPAVRVLLISADGAVLLAPIAFRLFRGSFDIFEPLLMAIFALMGMMIFRPLADIMTGHYVEHAYDISSTYTAALLLVLAANAAFIVGYELPLGQLLVARTPRASRQFNMRVGVIWATILSTLGIGIFSIALSGRGGLAFFLALSNGRTGTGVQGNPLAGTSGYIINAIGLLVPGASIFFAVFLRTHKRVYLLCAAAVLFPYLFLFIGSGSRSGTIGVLIGIPFMWYAYQHKRPGFTTLAICMIALAFFFSVQRDARAEAGASKGNAFYQALSDPITTILNLFRSDDDEMFDVIAQEIAVIPDWVPYHHFAVIEDVITRAMPRNLFPDKPVEAGEDFFATMEPARAKHSGAGTAPSIIGNFYLDSGAITAVFWMFVMGVCLSAIWEYYKINQASPILMIAFSVVPADVLAGARGDLPGLLASTPYGLLPILLLFLLQRVRLRESVGPSLSSTV